MRHRIQVVGLAAFAILTTSITARGQDDDVVDSALGGGRVKASLRAVGYYTDNFYNQPTDPAAGYGTLISPALLFLKESSKLQLGGVVDAEYGVFNLPGSQDDYFDGGARLNFKAQGSARNQVRLDASFKRGHDAFGVNRTDDPTAVNDELDLWNQTTRALHYRYGAAGARLNAEVGLARLERRYTTNRTATEPLNYDATSGGYTVFYNYSPKTAALVDFNRTDFSFDRPFGATDQRAGKLYQARAGFRWLATAKSSGDVRVGYRRRQFDIDDHDVEGLDWEASVDWAPVPRSQLKLEAARSEQESYRADARVIQIDSFALGWKYNLSARNRSILRIEHENVDFDISGRDDRILSGELALEHVVRSNLFVVANVGTAHRDSTAFFRDYDRLNAFIGVRLGR